MAPNFDITIWYISGDESQPADQPDPASKGPQSMILARAKLSTQSKQSCRWTQSCSCAETAQTRLTSSASDPTPESCFVGSTPASKVPQILTVPLSALHEQHVQNCSKSSALYHDLFRGAYINLACRIQFVTASPMHVREPHTQCMHEILCVFCRLQQDTHWIWHLHLCHSQIILQVCVCQHSSARPSILYCRWTL